MAVPELKARGVILQLFPLHEQRILNQLMTSWVQAVCERQPLGEKSCVFANVHRSQQRYIYDMAGAFQWLCKEIPGQTLPLANNLMCTYLLSSVQTDLL